MFSIPSSRDGRQEPCPASLPGAFPPPRAALPSPPPPTSLFLSPSIIFILFFFGVPIKAGAFNHPQL